MKSNLKLLLLIVTILSGAIFLVSEFAFSNNKQKEQPKKQDPLPYRWQPPEVPDTMSFAGEPVPLYRWEIREELDRQLLYNYYWQNNILYILKLANRYFPMIEERLRINGVPDHFVKYDRPGAPDQRSFNGGRKKFRFAMPVRVVFIRRSRRHRQHRQRHDPAHEIHDRFNRV